MSTVAHKIEEIGEPEGLKKTRNPFLEDYLYQIDESIREAEVTSGYGEVMDNQVAFEESIAMLNEPGKVIYFVGNGGSAGIAAHMATDFTKNGKLPALFLGDASLLTCLSNDLGYQEVFATPLRYVMKEGDVLVAISSSGNSANILNAVNAAQARGGKVITLSGFKQDNALRKIGDINWYLNNMEYGVVENAHQILIHSFLDKILQSR